MRRVVFDLRHLTGTHQTFFDKIMLLCKILLIRTVILEKKKYEMFRFLLYMLKFSWDFCSRGGVMGPPWDFCRRGEVVGPPWDFFSRGGVVGPP